MRRELPLAVFSFISSSLLSVAEVMTSKSTPLPVLKNSVMLMTVNYKTNKLLLPLNIVNLDLLLYNN